MCRLATIVYLMLAFEKSFRLLIQPPLLTAVNIAGNIHLELCALRMVDMILLRDILYRYA
jgi:hypothetical protein